MNNQWQKELSLYQAFCDWGNRFNYIPYSQRFDHNLKAYTVVDMVFGDCIHIHYWYHDGLKPQPNAKKVSFDNLDEALEWLQKDQTGLVNTRWPHK